MCRCSWPTHPMCSCWSRARMYLNSWITRLRCASVFSASTGTWSWSTQWTHRHGQWDIQTHSEDQFLLCIHSWHSFLLMISWSLFWRRILCFHCLCSAGSRCCRYYWGSLRRWWRGHRKTKEKTALLKVWHLYSSGYICTFYIYWCTGCY